MRKYFKSDFLFLALLLVACQSSLVPVSELAQWSEELEAAQPKDSFVAIYDSGDQGLVFVGAKHSNHTDSLSFKLIRQVFKYFPVETLIVEGPKYAAGPNEPELLDWAQSKWVASGFQKEGDIIPAIHGAISAGATIWGGEPDDEYVLKRVMRKGFVPSDLLGFYTLRSVPQWIREKEIESATDPKIHNLVEAELKKNRSRLRINTQILPTYEIWLDWYSNINNQEFGANFDPQEAAPLSSAPYGTNKIASAISVVRDEYLLHRIAHHLHRGENTMVVYGQSHLMIQRPALDRLLGLPCYVGSNIKVATTACKI